YPPFSFVDKNNKITGFSIELLEAVANEMGMDITFKKGYWKDIKAELRQEELDILPLVSYSEKRDEYFDFTTPYIVLHGTIFVRADNDNIKTIDDLKGKKVMVMEGDSAHEYAVKNNVTEKLISFPTYQEVFRKLASGENDAILIQEFVGLKIIEQLGLDNIKNLRVSENRGIGELKHKLGKFEQKFSFAVKDGDKELLATLNEGLLLVREHGTYRELYEKWFSFATDSGMNKQEFLIYTGKVIFIISVILITMGFFIMRREVKNKTSKLSQEIQKKEKVMKDLERSEKVFRNTVKNAPYPIMIHTEDGKVIEISQGWTDFSGYKKEDIPTTLSWIKKAYTNSQRKKMIETIDELYNLETPKNVGQFEIITKSGDKRIWDFRTTALGPAINGKKALISMAKDITEEKEIQENLREAKIGAERANEAKSAFLANMSHELRTPLNGVLGFAGILEETETDEEKLEMLNLIEESGEHLLEIVNDILNLSKIESGIIEVNNENFRLDKLLDSLEKTMIKLMKRNEKDITFEVILENKVPTYIKADKLKIKQILINLLSNAGKFTEKGKIELKVKYLKGNRIKFEIDDTGIGISKADQKRIFDKFIQGEHYLTKKYEGTGLGLSISLQLVDLLGGRLDLKSKKGKGSRFIVVLPLEEVIYDDDKKQKEPEIINKKQIKLTKKVIIAEDNKISQRLVEKLCKDKGINLKKTGDGKELIEELSKNKYDLILMDIQMPKMDGVTATKIIRRKGSNIPIVAITAFAQNKDKDFFISVGMDDYISKPIDRDEFNEVLERYLL
ncbi:MAG: transporter substrate-binding domain-containing protein, partial [Fusobacteriota bacterium]